MKYARISIVPAMAITATLFLSGCVANVFSGGPSLAGVVYTGVKDPAQRLAVALDSSAQSNRSGSASAQAVFGLFAFGDASIEAAMRNGGLTKVHHVDHKIELVLAGLWSRKTTLVYGE